MVFPLIAAGLEALSAYGVGSTVASLADDIPAIISMITKHGSADEEDPAIQQKREQDIVMKRDELVAKLVKSGVPAPDAMKQINDQLAPALEEARAAKQGDGQDSPSIAGPLIGAAVGLLPGVGALRGGLKAAKSAYQLAAAEPAVLGGVGKVAKGLGAGQWSLMKSGVMGAPNPNKMPGASSPWMAQGAASPMPGSSSPWMQQGSASPMPGSSSPVPGASSRLDPQALAAMARLRPRQPMAPPNAGGMREMTSDPGNRDFQMGERLLPYTPPQADEAMMIRLALQKLAPQGVEIE